MGIAVYGWAAIISETTNYSGLNTGSYRETIARFAAPVQER
jgi:hypothetical protein